MSLLSYDYPYNFSAASNSSNGNTANYSSQLNGPRTNDSISSPSALTSLTSKPTGSSPIGRQSTSSTNNNTSNSSSSSSSSLVNLNSPSNNSTSQTNNATNSIRTTTSNLLQQLDYNQAFTASTTNSSSASSNNLANYHHAAGQLIQTHSQITSNLNAGHQTSIQNSHHTHHSTQNSNTSNSIFTNSTNSHPHNSHHHSTNNSNNNLVLYNNNDLPDTKEGLDELCPVCGDKVSGYHYGLLTCESCKGFFKRTVQNKKVYNCVAERQCHIDKSQRKRCPYCRFQKCLNVGMKLEAVRADRMRGGRNKFGPMYKRDRARRMQILRQRQQTLVSLNSSLNSNASNSANNSISISNNNSSAIAAVCSSNLGSFAHGQITGVNNEPFSLLNPNILYNAEGIKQELIQIPHLSSSTSSPDSSPSPLSGNGLNNSAAGTGATANNLSINSNQPFGSVAATHPELAKWVNGNMSGVAGSAPSPIVSFNSASPGVRSLTVDLANSSLSSSSNNGAKQANSSPFGHFIENRNTSALAPSFLAGGSMLAVAANIAASASSSVRNLPFVINELQLTAPNDKEWQSNLFSLLHEHTYNQCEVDLFDLMCKVIEKNLFAQVDWARNSIFFKELKIEDQMKLLQHSWSHLLVLDHIHQRLHHCLQDESSLPNGQKFNLIGLALLGETSSTSDMINIQNTLAELKFDHVDYLCVKFLLLLNPDVRGLLNHRLVQEAQEQTQHALHQYTVNFYPQVTDKFNKLMNELPRLRQLTVRGEEFLHFKHVNQPKPSQTLLMEMLSVLKL